LTDSPHPDEVLHWLIRRVAAETQLDPAAIDVHLPFSDLGLESPRQAALAFDLGRVLNRDVDPTLLFEFPTISALTDHLVSAAEEVTRTANANRGEQPIAIVGIACRMPGATDRDGFWRLLVDGFDAVTTVPVGRWDPAEAGTPQWGGFADSVEDFDAAFFRIGAEEARRMDPQHRLLLETCWEALEDAGEVSHRLRGSATGVYVGISSNDYAKRQMRERTTISRHTGTGNSLAIAANRISYTFDFRGPSMSIDTACSSSLVAAHMACQALRSGECDRAVIAGVNLLLDPEVTIALQMAGMLAPDGRCKPFDAAANGYVRSEGCGVVVLKLLSAAVAVGDRIHAVIKGSAVNQDGSSNGLTAPNPAAQRDVLRAAYRNAGVDPRSVQYVECHGTGTYLGDPVEARALGAILGNGRDPQHPCLIGSVKGNIGHLESAAGIAGLIKVALALHHNLLPPSVNFHQPNPHIPFAELGLQVVESASPWPADGYRVAGVSSFGFGGTNAHLVLASAPAATTARVSTGPTLLPMSAPTEAGLHRLLNSWSKLLVEAGPQKSAELAAAASLRRTHHRHFRRAIAVDAAGLLGEAVRQAANEDRLAPGSASEPRVAFVFSGQGTWVAGTGRVLLESDPLFASTIRRCDEALEGKLGWSLDDAIRNPGSVDPGATSVAQPLTVALQLGLLAIWRALGITPVAVVGHSVGEIAAAAAAGMLDPAQAVRLAAIRGRLMDVPEAAGRMLAVGLTRDEALEIAAAHVSLIELAAVNGPRIAVLSGDPEALEEVSRELRVRGVFARWLPVTYAFHSNRVLQASFALEEEARGLRPMPASVPLYSPVLGRAMKHGELDAAYWRRNVRETVNFEAAALAMLDAGTDAVVEIGPTSALTIPLRQLISRAGTPSIALTTLDGEHDDRRSLLEAVSRLYEIGASIRFEYLFATPTRMVSLPAHPWNRERFWIDRARHDRDQRSGSVDASLVGTRVEVAGQSAHAIWQSTVSTDAFPWLVDHVVGGRLLLPASAFVELVVGAARGLGIMGDVTVTDLDLERPIVVTERPAILETSISGDGAGDWTVRIHSRVPGSSRDPWLLHAQARIVAGGDDQGRTPMSDVSDGEALEAAQFYQLLNDQGLDYGPRFRSVTRVLRTARAATAELSVPPGCPPVAAATVLLDGAFQLIAAAVGQQPVARDSQEIGVPARIRAIRYRAAAVASRAHSQVTSVDSRRVIADVTLIDARGQPVIEIIGLEVLRVEPALSPTPPPSNIHEYEVIWREQSLSGRGDGPRGRWLVLRREGPVSESMVGPLRAAAVDTVICTLSHAYDRMTAADALINVWERGDYERLVNELTEEPVGLSGVIDLTSLDIGDQRTPEWDYAQELESRTVSLLNLVRALSFAAAVETPRLVVVTSGCQPADGTVADPTSAVALGVLRTLPLENPLLSATCIDLDAEHPDIDLVLRELGSAGQDQEIAFRSGRRFVRRLRASCPTPRAANSVALPIRRDGTYLLTGGTHGLGRLVAAWLAREGAGHVVLLGRNPDPRLEANQRHGQVHTMAVDVRDRDALNAALAEIRRSYSPIHGIIHTAGVLADGALLDLDRAAVRSALAAKAAGAWYLHELTQNDPLDWFVLFSSAAGVLGSPGQGNYAAANTYLDALAHHRRRDGRPALSIDWGPWAEVGMAARAAETGGERRLRTATSAIEPGQGLAVLDQLLRASDRIQVLVVPFDLRDLLQFYPTGASRSLFEEVADESSLLIVQKPQKSGRPALVSPYLAPRNGVERQIVSILQKSIGVEPIGVLDNFFELGGDSVFGNQILVELSRLLNIPIDPEAAFEDFTAGHLAQLAEEGMVARLELMTDAEAEALMRDSN